MSTVRGRARTRLDQVPSGPYTGRPLTCRGRRILQAWERLKGGGLGAEEEDHRVGGTGCHSLPSWRHVKGDWSPRTRGRDGVSKAGRWFLHTPPPCESLSRVVGVLSTVGADRGGGCASGVGQHVIREVTIDRDNSYSCIFTDPQARRALQQGNTSKAFAGRKISIKMGINSLEEGKRQSWWK